MEEKNKSKEALLETLVVIFLGITAIFTAWGSWIGSLHGGNQATNYTESSNLAAEGNALWNEASQNYMQDMMIWNSISQLQIDYEYAEAKNDSDTMEQIENKLEQIISDNCTESFQEAVNWALEQEEYASPFDKDGFVESYYEEAQAVLQESEDKLEQGKKDNTNGDAYNLVTVLYSITLFLLGIYGVFKGGKSKTAVVIVALVIFVLATGYMFTIPMPTGFNLGSFFAG